MIFQSAKNKTLFFLSLFALFVIFLTYIASPVYFAKEKIDQHAEFLTNYGQTLQEGEVIKLLSKPTDTLFLEGSDDLVYWQAQRMSPYKYTWYTSVMPSFSKYTNARIKMFINNPPDFYREFGLCPKENPTDGSSIPEFVRKDYINLLKEDKPSCLYVRKEKLKEISENQWKQASTWHYVLPKEEVK